MNEITLPFSFVYTKVLQLVSVIAHSIFYFYIFWSTGSALYSFYLEFIKKDDASTFFAKRIIDLPFRKISFPLVLGFIPLLVIFSLDLIWLKGQEFNPVHNLSLITLLLFIISISLLYYYRFSFDLITLLPKSVVDKGSTEYIQLMENNLKNHKRAALSGTILLLITLYLISILNVAKLDYNEVDYRFDLIAYSVQLDVFLRFLFYLVLSFSITFFVSLFFNFVWEETKLDTTEGLSQFIEQNSLTGAFVSVLLQPVLILIDVLVLPKNSLSYWVFIASGLSIILLFLIANQLNAYRKENLKSYLSYSFYFMVFVLVFISIKDVVAFANVMKPKSVEISQNFLTYEENLKTKLNIKTVTISGEEIFTAKCSACHRFDQKLVGPPYNVVLKKYEDKKDQLVKFILNPVKVDPAYPPMPSQGLIPPEAEAVADYIMKVYKENQK
jgi:cytochrome c